MDRWIKERKKERKKERQKDGRKARKKGGWVDGWMVERKKEKRKKDGWFGLGSSSDGTQQGQIQIFCGEQQNVKSAL